MEITLDDFGSHFEGNAFKVFADHKILIFKEEGDTSQVCQDYDNEVAKSDKRHHRGFLNGIQCDMPIIIVANKVCYLFCQLYTIFLY